MPRLLTLTPTLVSVLRRRASPRSVVIEGQTLVAVWPSSVVRAVTDQPRCAINRSAFYALRRMAVAFAPAQEKMRSNDAVLAGNRVLVQREQRTGLAGKMVLVQREQRTGLAGDNALGSSQQIRGMSNTVHGVIPRKTVILIPPGIHKTDS